MRNSTWLPAAVCLVALTFLGDDCEDSDKAKSSPSDKPNAAKLAGWEPGEVRVCALTGSADGPDVLISKAALGDEGMHDFTLRKQDKGYCEFMRPSWLRYGFDFVFAMAAPEGGTALTEVGVYYLDAPKDNPAPDDFKYAKAVKAGDGVFYLRMTPVAGLPTVKFAAP